MLRWTFLPRLRCNSQIDPYVKFFIISESLLWSAWSLLVPLFALFVMRNVSGGDMKVATGSLSTYFISRILVELISSKYITKASEVTKIALTVLGTILLSLAFLGLALADTVGMVFINWAIAGISLGFISPAKLALFSVHLDQNQEAREWGLYDAAVLACMGLATAVGGILAERFGFTLLFIFASWLNFLAVIPYLVYLKSKLGHLHHK